MDEIIDITFDQTPTTTTFGSGMELLMNTNISTGKKNNSLNNDLEHLENELNELNHSILDY